jgi:hypothetical protein
MFQGVRESAEEVALLAGMAFEARQPPQKARDPSRWFDETIADKLRRWLSLPWK